MAGRSFRPSDSQLGRASGPPAVTFQRRTSSGRYVNLSRDSIDSDINSVEFSEYTVHIPPTPDNQPMDPSMSMRIEPALISQRVEEQYVSSSLFTGGFNSVTRAHLMDKVIESETNHPQMAGAKGSSCAIQGCDGKVMSDERGEDILPCECDFKICRDCFIDSVRTGDGICPGCKEPYKNTDLSANSVEPGQPLSLPSTVGMSKMERRLSLMKSANRVSNPNDDARWLWMMSIICELWFAFSWLLDQLPKLCPVNRATDLNVLKEKFETPSPANPTGKSDLPGIDIFVSTADPEKEPPLVTANTILSILAADYPVEKLSCYVSDDGGALLTFEAMAEAASFANLWVPFCRKHDIEPRNPESYFSLKKDPFKNKVRQDFVKDRRRVKREYDEFKVRINGLPDSIRRRSDAYNAREEIKALKLRRQNAEDETLEALKVSRQRGWRMVMLKPPSDETLYGTADSSPLTLPKLTFGFPCLSMFLVKRDQTGFRVRFMSALVASFAGPHFMGSTRPARKTTPAVAAVVLLVVRKVRRFKSAPEDHRALRMGDSDDDEMNPSLISKRFGNSSLLIDSIPVAEFQGRPLADHPAVKNGRPPGALTIPRELLDASTVAEAISVISCWYEDKTEWGNRVGWIYGSVTEDVVTGYRMHNRGWKSIYCVTKRDAFRGTAPINLTDRLHQVLRWATGSVEIFFSRNNALLASSKMKILQRIAYLNVGIYPFTSLFLIVYCFLPALSLFSGQFIVQSLDVTFLTYLLGITLTLCALAVLEIKWSGINLEEWWRNEQFWLIGGTSAHLAAVLQGLLKVIAGIEISFTLTSKSAGDENDDEFADLYILRWSSLMIPPITIMITNLIAIAVGVSRTIYSAIPQWSRLLGGVFFSFWVLAHLYPFAKGLMGRRGRTPRSCLSGRVLLRSLFPFFGWRFLRRQAVRRLEVLSSFHDFIIIIIVISVSFLCSLFTCLEGKTTGKTIHSL
ncbi:hypothetical protein DH2020_002037 [Rehmannia glutinosa]|uniref:Cellulose synthase-like protein n=1 Tax=Rehmannia glutinosa TaxID=99300 RepID=A0ABR0XT61_REHGL